MLCKNNIMTFFEISDLHLTALPGTTDMYSETSIKRLMAGGRLN